MDNNNWWFYLEPYVHITIKSGKMLLYNTLDATYIETSEPLLVELVSEIFDRQNLGIATVSNDKVSSQPYKAFITEVRSKYMGDVISTSNYENKPIQLFPRLNLQKDIERVQNQRPETIGQKALSNLSELILFINNTCSQNCAGCSWYMRQTKCCSKFPAYNKGEELPIDIVKQLLKRHNGIKIALSGGNIFLYSQWDLLSELISQNPVTLYINYLNLADANILPAKAVICMLIPFPIRLREFEHALNKAGKHSVQYHFLITNEDELEQSETIISEYKLKQNQIIPIYNGSNEPFFKENIFLNKDDIFDDPLSMKRIFSQQVANAKFFGGLYVLPNCDVVANPNTKVLGNLRNSNILEIVQKELLENSAWRVTRTQQPCADCLYQYLCPPPSNYELVMEKSTICDGIEDIC